jgi:hypothetical protein
LRSMSLFMLDSTIFGCSLWMECCFMLVHDVWATAPAHLDFIDCVHCAEHLSCLRARS